MKDLCYDFSKKKNEASKCQDNHLRPCSSLPQTEKKKTVQ